MLTMALEMCGTAQKMNNEEVKGFREDEALANDHHCDDVHMI